MLAERNRETVASQTEDQWDTLTLLREIGTGPLPDIGLRNEMVWSRRQQDKDWADTLEMADVES